MNIDRIVTHLSRESGEGTAMLSRHGKSTISHFLCFSKNELLAKREDASLLQSERDAIELILEEGIQDFQARIQRKKAAETANAFYVNKAIIYRTQRGLGRG